LDPVTAIETCKSQSMEKLRLTSRVDIVRLATEQGGCVSSEMA
jgi:hypothetical protein